MGERGGGQRQHMAATEEMDDFFDDDDEEINELFNHAGSTPGQLIYAKFIPVIFFSLPNIL